MKKTTWKTAIAAVIVLGASAATAAPPTLLQKCQATKNKIAGQYYACREKAEATAVTKGIPADYSKCTAKFNEKWAGAETTGAGMCPDDLPLSIDMDVFITDQAAQAAGMVAGTTEVPACGDGAINVAGEHCDGAVLDGKTCASFGLFGSLTCTPDCELDLSACTVCPASTVAHAGACWVLGAPAASCNTACGALGLVYDDMTSLIAGSDGSNANCLLVADLLGAEGSGLTYPDSACTTGFGCAVDPMYDNRGRCATPPTDAASVFGSFQRICACE